MIIIVKSLKYKKFTELFYLKLPDEQMYNYFAIVGLPSKANSFSKPNGGSDNTV